MDIRFQIIGIIICTILIVQIYIMKSFNKKYGYETDWIFRVYRYIRDFIHLINNEKDKIQKRKFQLLLYSTGLAYITFLILFVFFLFRKSKI
jgi:hypothetical protein